MGQWKVRETINFKKWVIEIMLLLIVLRSQLNYDYNCLSPDHR